jgi:hypothetical protein
MRLELFLALAFVGWFSAPCHAQDPGVEISAQADRAVAQFKMTWSKNKATLDALRAREMDENKSLQHLLEMAGLPKNQACPDQDKTTNERAITINLRSVSAAFESAMKSEVEEYESRSRELNDVSDSAYATRISLFDKIVWSRARAQMMVFLSNVFDEYEQVMELTTTNTCAARKLLLAKWSTPKEASDIQRKETSRREAREASSRSEGNVYTDTLNLIIKLP